MYFRELECVDVNECETNNGGCNQRCVNTQGQIFPNFLKMAKNSHLFKNILMILMLGSFSCQCHSEYYLNVTTKNCDFRLHQQISDEHFFLIMAYSNSDIKDPYRIYHQEKRPIGPIWGAPGRPGWDLSLVGDEIWRSETPLIDFHVNPKLPPAGFIVEESRILYTSFTKKGGKVIL